MEKQPNGEIKKWRKPALVVLVRARPEEAVLGACKMPIPGYTGPANSLCNGSNLDCQSQGKS